MSFNPRRIGGFREQSLIITTEIYWLLFTVIASIISAIFSWLQEFKPGFKVTVQWKRRFHWINMESKWSICIILLKISILWQICLDDSTLLEKQSANSIRHKCWGSTLTFPAQFQLSQDDWIKTYFIWSQHPNVATFCWLNMHVACRMEWDMTTSISLLIVIVIYKAEWIAISDFEYAIIISPDCTSWVVVCCLFSFLFSLFFQR